MTDETSTEATDLAASRVVKLATGELDEDLYPDGTVFIPADIPDFGRTLYREILERSPIVVVYPDGRERFLRPVDPLSPERGRRGGLLGRLSRTRPR